MVISRDLTPTKNSARYSLIFFRKSPFQKRNPDWWNYEAQVELIGFFWVVSGYAMKEYERYVEFCKVDTDMVEKTVYPDGI